MNASRNTALALIILMLAGCSAQKRALRQEKKEIGNLGEAAGLYWHSMRWSDYGTAASFYLNDQYRMDWMNMMVEAPPYKYSSASVMRVEVSPEFAEPVDGVEREGRVFIQVQGYKLPEQVMEQKMVTQIWERYEAGWFVSMEGEEASGGE